LIHLECLGFFFRAYACVVALQSGEKDHVKAWKLICDVSRKDFDSIYKRLDIHPDFTERGESFYQSRMTEIVKLLENKGLLVEEEGRKLMFGDEGQVVHLKITNQ